MFQANLEYCKSNRKTILRFRLLQYRLASTVPVPFRFTTDYRYDTVNKFMMDLHLSPITGELAKYMIEIWKILWIRYEYRYELKIERYQ